jgi:hypothetical protein
MCFEHHDEYDTRTSQSKGWTVAEAKEYRQMLYGAIKSLRDAAVTSVEQFDYRPIPVFSQMLSICTSLLSIVWLSFHIQPNESWHP